MSADLLEAALAYHALGRPVIPVKADKTPACQEWGLWRFKPQTEEEVRQLFANGAHGIAVLTWPACDLLVLDFDGTHAEQVWTQKTGIALPPTGRHRTRGGWLHNIFRTPDNTSRPERQAIEAGLRRKVRLVVDLQCGCEKPCGVDLLVNGYFIVPPTPGYAEDPDAPSDPGNLAVIPAEVLALARAAERENGDARPRTDLPGAPIPHGQRNATLASLAGTMRRRGMTEAAIRTALLEENTQRCTPPLPEREVLGIASSIGKYRPAEVRHQEPLPPEAPAGDLPPFPAAAYVGLGAEFASRYSEHLEAPPQFLYLDFITYFGAMVAAHVRLETQLREEPRLFLVKAGESWLARKSSSQDEVEHFFGPIVQDRLVACYGAGSAEGLAKRMQAGLPTILVYDEFRSFVEKARVEGSVLLPMVASLFSRTIYENATKQSEISLRDAHLSLVAACTIDTFTTMFTPQFRSIGLLNRLFVVGGRRGELRPLPDRIPDAIVAGLRERTLEQIERAEREKPLLRFTAAGRAVWEDYYRALPESPYAARLDTYGLRLLMLFALTTGSGQVDRPLVDAVVALLGYEFRVRRELDPVDAEGMVARTEQLILRALERGRMSGWRLRNYCHVERTGLWAFETATRNLRKQGWLATGKNGRTFDWWLTPAGREAVGDGEEGRNTHQDPHHGLV